jgi:type IV pilus assembly protein PilM
MSEKELKSSITFEAEQYIPIPLKDINFDFQILDPDPANKNKMNVLIVAAKHTVLNKYVGILKKAGLTPRSMEPETLAIGRILGDTMNKPSASIILNVGTVDTQIIVSYKGYVRFTRSIAVGGDSFTKAVEQQLGFDNVQAEEYKKTYGLDSKQADGKVFAAIKPVFNQILTEVKRSKVFYTTHNPNVIISRLIISGGSALMPGLLFYVANSLDLEVEMANPWRNIQFIKALEPQKQKLVDTGPLYVTAVGLALKDLKE